MRQEVTLTHAIGKTLEDVAYSTYSNQMVITFTDDTFATLGVTRGYEVGEEQIDEDQLSLLDFGDRELLRVGILTSEELKKLRDDRTALLQADREARDKAEFERLKQKFGV